MKLAQADEVDATTIMTDWQPHARLAVDEGPVEGLMGERGVLVDEGATVRIDWADGTTRRWWRGDFARAIELGAIRRVG